jgi:GH24 family phage-related lysozyme (muramidase)
MMATYLDLSLKKLEEFEGSIPWMYRDAAGNVLVGVGLVLPDATTATRLGFTVNGRAATAKEIIMEFRRVDALPMGRPALFYRGADRPELPQDEIDSLLLTVLVGFDAELRTAFADYDGFPDSVKMALLDMGYNLGPAGLLDGYPRMIGAVVAGAWAQAAANCERIGPGAARNTWTREMFLEAAGTTTRGDGVLKQVGYGMVGLTASLWQKVRRK